MSGLTFRFAPFSSLPQAGHGLYTTDIDDQTIFKTILLRTVKTKIRAKTQPAKSWQDLEDYYVEVNQNGFGHDRLLELIRYIKHNPVSQRIYGSVFMLDNLILSIYNPIEWDREALHIMFDKPSQKWIFEYFAKPNERPEFKRQYRAELGIEKFDQFVQMIRW